VPYVAGCTIDIVIRFDGRRLYTREITQSDCALMSLISLTVQRCPAAAAIPPPLIAEDDDCMMMQKLLAAAVDCLTLSFSTQQ